MDIGEVTATVDEQQVPGTAVLYCDPAQWHFFRVEFEAHHVELLLSDTVLALNFERRERLARYLHTWKIYLAAPKIPTERSNT